MDKLITLQFVPIHEQTTVSYLPKMRFYEDSFNCLRLPGPGQIEKTLWAVTHVEMRRSARLRPVLDFLSELVAHASRANNYDVRLQAFEQPSF